MWKSGELAINVPQQFRQSCLEVPTCRWCFWCVWCVYIFSVFEFGYVLEVSAQCVCAVYLCGTWLCVLQYTGCVGVATSTLKDQCRSTLFATSTLIFSCTIFLIWLLKLFNQIQSTLFCWCGWQHRAVSARISRYSWSCITELLSDIQWDKS